MIISATNSILFIEATPISHTHARTQLSSRCMLEFNTGKGHRGTKKSMLFMHDCPTGKDKDYQLAIAASVKGMFSREMEL